MKIKDDRLIDCGYVEWKSTELLYVIDLQAIIIIECQILYRSTTKTTVERVNNETRDPSRQVQQRKKSINSILKRHQVCAWYTWASSERKISRFRTRDQVLLSSLILRYFIYVDLNRFLSDEAPSSCIYKLCAMICRAGCVHKKRPLYSFNVNKKTENKSKEN